MTNEELIKKSEELAAKVKETLADVEKKAEAAAKGEISKLEDGDIKKLKEQLNEYHQANVKASEDRNKTQKQIDELEASVKKYKEQGASNPGAMSVMDAMQKAFNENDRFKEYQKTKTGMSGESINLKAVGIMLPGTQVGAGVQPEARRPGIVPVVRRQVRIRDLMTTGTTDTDNFKFIQETGGEGGPTTVAPGDSKPQSDNDVASVTAPVRKIAHHKRIAEELVNDVPGLVSFLTSQGIEELLDVEDTQLLYGAGTGSTLTGLTINASVTATSNPLAGAVDNAQTVDAIIAGIVKLAASNYMADYALIHPTDYYKMLTIKLTDNNYLNGRLVWENGMAMIDGIPVIKSTAVTAGGLLVGNFGRGAQLIQREGVNVRFYDQDQDNAIKNLVTVVIEERLALPIYYPTMFTFDAITDITTAIETA